MRVKLIVTAIAAVFAVSAVAAAGAQAEASGPFWRISCHQVSTANKGLGSYGDAGCLTSGGSKEWDTRMLAGEEAGVSAKAAKSVVLHLNGAVTVTCTSQKLETAAADGSSSSTGSVLFGNLALEGCKVTGNGETCSVKGGKISFANLEFQLGYQVVESKRRFGNILMLLQPRKSFLLTQINFQGRCGNVEFDRVEGSLAAEVLSGGKPIPVGSEPPAAKSLEINIVPSGISSVWMEKAGVLTQMHPSTESGYGIFRAEDKMEVSLLSGGSFGVFTQ